MIKLTFGIILIIIGLSLFSPIDEIFILIPLSLIFGAWLIPAWTAIAVMCLGLGIFLAGKSNLIPNPIAHHIWFFISVSLAICVYLFYILW